MKKYHFSKSGIINICHFEPIHLNEPKISKEIRFAFKKLVKNNYNELVKMSENYDDVDYNVAVLISFTTEEGYRAKEKGIYRDSYKSLDEIDYTYFEKQIFRIIVDLFIEYNIEIIDQIIVKLF